MKKIVMSAMCLWALSSIAHAGFLDKLTNAAADVEKAKAKVADTKAMTQSPKDVYVTLIKTRLGEKASPTTVAAQLGKPTVDSGVNAVGVQNYLYNNSAILAYLGSAAAMLGSFVPADQQTQFTFTNAILTDVKLVAAVAAPADVAAATIPATPTLAPTPAFTPTTPASTPTTMSNSTTMPSADAAITAKTIAAEGKPAMVESAEAKAERCRKLLAPKITTKKVADPAQPKPQLSAEEKQQLQAKREQRLKDKQDCL